MTAASVPVAGRRATVTAVDRSQGSASGGAQSSNLISWKPNQELDAREWAAAGRRLGAVGRCIQWLLGDWIAYGNTKFGDRYARASRITGYDVQTLMNMVYVALRFPDSRRRGDLSWSHHETLASMDPDGQEHWLDEASRHRWSVADLRMMLRTVRKKEGTEKLPGEQPEFSDASGSSPNTAVTCPRCGEQVPVAST
jgi:hypothetical protein